jgi:hypothetical protein
MRRGEDKCGKNLRGSTCNCIMGGGAGELSRYNNGLQAGWPRFDSPQSQRIIYSVQTCSGAFPAFYRITLSPD